MTEYRRKGYLFKIILLAVFLSTLVVLSGCRRNTGNPSEDAASAEVGSNPADGDGQEETPESSDHLDMPEGFKMYSENAGAVWVAGMLVTHLNCAETDNPFAEEIQAFEKTENKVRVSALLQNGLEKIQPYYFMILVDGLPVQFSVDHQEYGYYPVELETEACFEAEFEPVFTSGYGRVDYLFFYDGDPVSEFHCISQSALFRNDLNRDEAGKELYETAAVRNGLVNIFPEGAVRAWFSPEEALTNPDFMENFSKYRIGKNEEVILETIIAKTGEYRTVLICDHRWKEIISQGKSYRYIDWKASYGQMLQIPVNIPAGESDVYSCFTIHTPLEPEKISEKPYVSGKTEFTIETGQEEQ